MSDHERPDDTPLSELPFAQQLERDLVMAAARKVDDKGRQRTVTFQRVAVFAAACVMVALVPAGIAIFISDGFGTRTEPDALATPTPTQIPGHEAEGFLSVEADDVSSGQDVTQRLRFTLDGDLPPNTRIVIDLFEMPSGVYPEQPARLRQEGGSGVASFYPGTPSIEYLSGGKGDEHASTIELIFEGLDVPEDFHHVQTAWFHRPDVDKSMQTTFQFGAPQ